MKIELERLGRKLFSVQDLRSKQRGITPAVDNQLNEKSGNGDPIQSYLFDEILAPHMSDVGQRCGQNLAVTAYFVKLRMFGIEKAASLQKELKPSKGAVSQATIAMMVDRNTFFGELGEYLQRDLYMAYEGIIPARTCPCEAAEDLRTLTMAAGPQIAEYRLVQRAIGVYNKMMVELGIIEPRR